MYLETDQKRYNCYTENFKYPYSKNFTGQGAKFKEGNIKCLNEEDTILIGNGETRSEYKSFLPQSSFPLWVNEKEFITKALCLDESKDKEDGVIPVKKDQVVYGRGQLPEINCKFVTYDMECSPEEMKRTFFADYKIVGFDKKFRVVQTTTDFIVER